jgi:DNA-3-methyladenine glycosylase II
VLLTPRGPFSLAQSAAFVDRFAPAAAPQPGGARVRLALSDDSGPALAFEATQPDGDNGAVVVEYDSALPEARVRQHVERVLGLDVDATGWPDVGRRDPAIGALQERFPGRRPVQFGTPFEAAAWALLSQRTSMTQAARVKERLAVDHGPTIELAGGPPVRAFPAPETIEQLDELRGVPAVKVGRLREIAAAARAGDLEAADLRALEPAEALARLQELPGVGPFSATLILIRGVGHPDVAALAEPRLRTALARAYGRAEADFGDAAVLDLAEAWRPFRSWAAFLLRSSLADT